MLHSVYLSARLSLPVTLVTFELTIFLLFFTPLPLLNYFLFNLFLFLQKSGGSKARPPQPLPLRGPCNISPSFWNWCVDDTFPMFNSRDSANAFLHYLNSCHSNVKFTIEFEQNNAIPFLDILITRNQNNTFMTSIYRKKTFTGLYTKWDSFTPRKYK